MPPDCDDKVHGNEHDFPEEKEEEKEPNPDENQDYDSEEEEKEKPKLSKEDTKDMFANFFTQVSSNYDPQAEEEKKIKK